MTNPAAYFEGLTTLLREQGMPPRRIEALVRELTAYAQEAGSDPEAEFGPAAELAARLTERDRAGSAGLAEEPEGETWVLRVDALQEQRLLDRFGAEGWEVDGLDRLGGFVCRREPHRPMRWEYRRETVGERARAGLTERLAPDEWEPCGVWGPFAYYKRPAAASAGPAAELAEPPAPPRRRVYFGAWIYVCVFCLAVAAGTLVWLGWQLHGMSVSERAGALVGLLLCLLLGWSLWRLFLRGRQPGGEARQDSRPPSA